MTEIPPTLEAKIDEFVDDLFPPTQINTPTSSTEPPPTPSNWILRRKRVWYGIGLPNDHLIALRPSEETYAEYGVYSPRDIVFACENQACENWAIIEVTTPNYPPWYCESCLVTAQESKTESAETQSPTASQALASTQSPSSPNCSQEPPRSPARRSPRAAETSSAQSRTAKYRKRSQSRAPQSRSAT